MKIPTPLTSESYDVFNVRQITRATPLESIVAVDMVHIDAHSESHTHRHNKSDTILLITSGEGEVHVEKSVFAVSSGERIHIPPGAFHKVVTGQSNMEFISVQSPPILKESDALDLEFEQNEETA